MRFSDVLTHASHFRRSQPRAALLAALASGLALLLSGPASHAQVVGSPPLGFPFPASITEDWNAVCTGSADVNEQCNQIGTCVSGTPGTSLNCTANDFAITNLQFVNVVDACTGPDDYFMADISVRFNKQTPARYDPHAWFYRGNDTTAGTSFNDENADSGTYCTRIGLEAGLDIIDDGDMVTVLGQTGAAETGGNSPTPDCVDAAVSGTAFMDQTILGVVLPCRDITDASLGLTADGIVDISACTSWDNNTDKPNGGQCNGPQYDGVDEPEAGTSSKCGCSEFDGGALQVSLPNIAITKTCLDASDGDTNVSPGGVANCTIIITNSGLGILDGAISSSDEGYNYVDTFPVDSTAGGAVSNVNITNNNTVGDDPNYQSAENVTVDNGAGILTIYPDNIRGNNGTNGVVTVTYDFTVNSTTLDTEQDLTNTVCSSYLDSDTGTSITSDTDCSSAIITTPVTLASFYAYRDKASGELAIEWTTATEVANLGFNLYVALGRTRFPLNAQLIPSKASQSTQPLSYAARFPDPAGRAATKLYLEDLDIMGVRKMHGPFHIHRGYGKKPNAADVQRIDWASIRAKRRAAKKPRGAARGIASRSLIAPQSTHSAQTALNDERLAVKITTPQAGVHRITYEALAALGLELRGLDPNDISLHFRGEPVPFYLGGRDSDRFEPGDHIDFIAAPEPTLYSPGNVYLLTFHRRGKRARIHSVPATASETNYSPYYMESLTLTRDQAYNFASPLPGDPWHDAWLLAVEAPKAQRYTFQAEGLAAAAKAGVTVEASIVGGIDWPEDPLDHHIVMSLNGAVVAERRFDGLRGIQLTAQAPLGLLRDGDNLIDLTLPANNANAIDAVHIDAVQVRYPRHYVAKNDYLSFTSSDREFRVEGFSNRSFFIYAQTQTRTRRLRRIRRPHSNGGYAAIFRGIGRDVTYHVTTSQSVLTPAMELMTRNDITQTAADHLIIAPTDFHGPTLDHYAAQRREWFGGSHVIIDVNDIYDNYSHSMADAEAIKQFIADTHARSALQSVLFVGGDTYDYHNRLGLNSVSFVPTLYRATDRIVKFSPVDAAYGDLDGDRTPEIPVGRLPVRTNAELDLVTQKLMAYQNLPDRHSALLVADDFQGIEGYHFAQASDLIGHALSDAGWAVERLYLGRPGMAAELRLSLVDALNEGPALTVFTGHSGLRIWTFDGIFSSADAAALTNHGLPTTVIQWGCWNTYFVDPMAQTLGHRFLLSGDQGAATVLGASTLTVAQHERELSQLLNQELLANTAIGQALNRAKQLYVDQFGEHPDVTLGINLLGDPLFSIK